jgi:hypothetical protein
MKKELHIKFGLLKSRYQNAVENGDDELGIEGLPMLTAYAKYLIQHIESKPGVSDDTLITLYPRDASE